MSPRRTGVKSHLARKIHKNVIPIHPAAMPLAQPDGDPKELPDVQDGEKVVSGSIAVFEDPALARKRIG